MRFFIFIFFLTILSILGCGKDNKYPYKISDFKTELNDHLKKIVLAGELPNKPDTIVQYYLRDSCTKEELLKLMLFENPIVRVLAFSAIINRNEPDYFPILINHLDDTSKVTLWYCDDAVADFMVSDMMIGKVIRAKKLNQFQKDSLVDIVLMKHSYLEKAEKMMYDIKPNEKYYSIIKLRAQKNLKDCHDLRNTYSLAKFNKQEDIPLIKKNFIEFTDNPYCNNYYFKAIEAFSDTAFFHLLSKYLEENIKKKEQDYTDDLKYFCRAVAKYKSPNSLKILKELSKKETYPNLNSKHFEYNQENIFKAIHKYNSPIYEELYQTLKPQMDSYVLENLGKPDYNDERNYW